jgi:MFS family permease
VVFAGIIVGSVFWGIFSDWYGRKISFIFATAVITIGGILTGFASSFELLLFYRCLVGFGIGRVSFFPSLSLSYAYLSLSSL